MRKLKSRQEDYKLDFTLDELERLRDMLRVVSPGDLHSANKLIRHIQDSIDLIIEELEG